MRIYRSYKGQPARIGYSHDTGLAIILRDILYQPVYRIPGIGALVYCPRILCMDQWLMYFHPAFTFVFATDILDDENISFHRHIKERIPCWHIKNSIIGNRDACTIWGALNQDRCCLAQAHRRENDGV